VRITHAKVEQVAQNALAAVTNEQITRQRVEKLEALRGRGFWGRLRWLFTGR
jgi:stalled ribosome alternative rescue factor ArfA